MFRTQSTPPSGDRRARWPIALLVATTTIVGLIYSGLGHQIYGYIHASSDDVPSVWPLELGEVTQLLENSIHYTVNTELGIAQWNATLPTGGAVVHLGTPPEPYTVSLFHELRCLNIVREILVEFYADDSIDARPPRQQLANHCMNYLREMILCRSDTRLQTVRSSTGSRRTVLEASRTCKDWNAVYDAAEENFAAYRGRV